VSVFRPSARATGPDGRAWEIYAYRIKLRERGPHGDSPLEYAINPEIQAIGGFEWLVRGCGRLLVRLFVDLPVAAVRSIGSTEWTIEAATFGAQPESLKWRTTSEYRGQVLAHVEGSLARGDHPRPRNAWSVR
jgi:hypothetical protein